MQTPTFQPITSIKIPYETVDKFNNITINNNKTYIGIIIHNEKILHFVIHNKNIYIYYQNTYHLDHFKLDYGKFRPIADKLTIKIHYNEIGDDNLHFIENVELFV